MSISFLPTYCTKINMKSSSSSSSSFLCSSSISTPVLPFGRPLSAGCSRSSLDSPKRVLITRIMASRREANDQNYSGRLVDENMIVLRKRIREMKVVERNFEPPSHWMEWEKQCFGTYDSLVCDMVGFLQSQLMDARPALALGIIGLVTLSVPMSTAMVFLHLMELTKMVLSGISPP